MEYNNMINSIVKYIAEYMQRRNHKNIIIVGRNFIGKTDIFSRLVDEVEELNFYFIDTCNRTINVKDIAIETNQGDVSIDDVVGVRLSNNNINKNDTYGGLPGGVERQVMANKEEVERLFNGLMKTELSITVEDIDGIVKQPVLYIDHLRIAESIRLSNGYQAIIRILLELVILRAKTKNSHQKYVVMIDEIDIHLSSETCTDLMEYLDNEFVEFEFIVSTHSKDVVVGARNVDILIMTEDSFEIYDGDEIESMYDAQGIWSRIVWDSEGRFGRSNNKERLKEIYNHVLNGADIDDDRAFLDALEMDKLSGLEQIIYDEIKSKLSKT